MKSIDERIIELAGIDEGRRFGSDATEHRAEEIEGMPKSKAYKQLFTWVKSGTIDMVEYLNLMDIVRE